MHTDNSSRAAAPAAMRDEEFVVATASGKIFAKLWGRLDAGGGRKPIVLFHDSIGSVELWRDFPEKLAQATDRPVIAYDRLGFGKSDPCSGRLPRDFIRRQARGEFAALRDHLRIGQMILFGHSVGGGMAVAAGATFLEATLAVITVAAQAMVEDRTLEGIRRAQAAFEQPGQMQRLARYHGDKARWALDAWTKTWLSPDFADWTLDEDLRALRCPVLALHGENDEYGSPAQAKRIAELAPGDRQAVILGGCGHTPHREQPEAVLNAVGAFLDPLP